MSEIMFPGDSYVTPPGMKKPLSAIFPYLYFLVRILGIVRHDGLLAEKGKYGGKEWSEGSRSTLRLLEDMGISMSVEGMDNIDKVDGPCIFAGNHMSTLETFVLPCFIQPRRDVTFVVKRSLLKYPWFGPVLAAREPVILDRQSPREDLVTMLSGGMETLEKGKSLIIFPQSTRSSDFSPSQFNSIAVKLAARAGVPVIPFALRTDAWGVGRILKDFGRINPDLPVKTTFGEPVYVSGKGRAEQQQIITFISDTLQSWGVQVRD